MKVFLVLLFTTLLLQLTCSSATKFFTYHTRVKRSCSFKGEQCTKDYECCTSNCICVGHDPCECGKRPKPKIIRAANFLDTSNRDRDKSFAQSLVCRYINDNSYY